MRHLTATICLTIAVLLGNAGEVDALDKVKEFATNLQSNVSITFEDDGMYQFFGNGTRIATWICGDEEDDLPVHGINRKLNPKKGYLRKEKAWETVFWRV